jgi:hypothetical protein
MRDAKMPAKCFDCSETTYIEAAHRIDQQTENNLGFAICTITSVENLYRAERGRQHVCCSTDLAVFIILMTACLSD